MKKLNLGGSGADLFILDNNYLLKISTNEKSKKTIEAQAKLLNKLPFSPEIVKTSIQESQSYYIMPYYNFSTLDELLRCKDTELALLGVNRIFQYIKARKGKKQVSDDFFLYYNQEKVLPNLKRGDIIPPPEMVRSFTDNHISYFHGDMTAENILMNGDDFILLDPHPTEWRSYTLELSKFLCSTMIGYEFLRDNKEKTKTAKQVEKLVSDKIEHTPLLYYLMASQFLRIIPYNNQPQFRFAYNRLMLEAINQYYDKPNKVYCDFDGVIVDSIETNAHAYEFAVNNICDHTISYEDVLAIKSPSFTELMDKLGVPKEQRDEVHKLKHEFYEHDVESVLWHEATIDFIADKMVDADVNVWTKSSQKSVQALLNKRKQPILYDRIIYDSEKKAKDLDGLVIEDDERVIEDCRKHDIPYIQVKK